MPQAMMDLLLSGSAQHSKAAGSATAATATRQEPSGSKKQPHGAYNAGKATPQQHGHSPAAAAGKVAAGTAAGAGATGPKLCLVCAQRRCNVLLMPPPGAVC